ncbi:MAG: hypothetical protein M1493_13750 [Firmicutes bacterium]|nr:hypothetical protein [Bacillota bacterium]
MEKTHDGHDSRKKLIAGGVWNYREYGLGEPRDITIARSVHIVSIGMRISFE